MPRISQYHIDEFDRQGCADWDEYCNRNQLNYSDLYEFDEDEDEEEEDY